MRTLALTIAALSLTAPRVGAVDSVQDTVVQHTLTLLQQRLADSAPVQAAALVADVGTATSRTPAQVRAHLLDRVQRLWGLRDRDPEAWTALIDLRAEDMSRRQAQRLLSEVIDAARGILEAGDDYLLGTSIRHAGRSARVPPGEAGAFVRRLVAHGIVDTTSDWAPEPVGLVVSGWTEPYEFSFDPLYVFFATDQEAFVREEVRDVQRFVVPRLTRLLSRSRGVDFALRDRDLTALVDPDFGVRVVVQSLRFTGTNTDLLPCIDVRAELTDTATGSLAWQTDITHCTREHGSAHDDHLDPFFDEVAEQLFTRLDEYFETPR